MSSLTLLTTLMHPCTIKLLIKITKTPTDHVCSIAQKTTVVSVLNNFYPNFNVNESSSKHECCSQTQ